MRVPWFRGKLIGVDAVIEPHFGVKSFGAPDAIAKLDFAEGASAVLILEAKLCEYRKAASPPNRRGERGYNSSLNGQLELNHRLAEALAVYTVGPLSEEKWVLDTPYGRDGVQRSVQKSAVLHELALPFGKLAPKQYFQIAVTTDPSNPFDNSRLKCLWPEVFAAGGRDVSEEAQAPWLD